MLLYKGKEFLPKDLPAEKYIKRVNTYLTLQLEIQKFDKNFLSHIENYDTSENSELEDLKDMIEREMNTEKENENKNSQKNLPKHDISKKEKSEINLPNPAIGEYKNEKTNSNLPKPAITEDLNSDRNAEESRIQSAQCEGFASPSPLGKFGMGLREYF